MGRCNHSIVSCIYFVGSGAWFPRRRNVLGLGALRNLGVASIGEWRPTSGPRVGGVNDACHTYAHACTCKDRLSSDVGIRRDQ